jgi:hypothetical protein
MPLVTVIAKFGDQPSYKLFRCGGVQVRRLGKGVTVQAAQVQRLLAKL